jgi:type IX secretion system PorP/SprF family membrane protein
MRKIYSILLLCLAFVANTQAQDPRFTQHYNSPLRQNPAMTGVMNGSWRAIANYRDQWSSVLGGSAYRTYSIGGDANFFAFKKDFVGVGFYFLGDQAGSGRFSHQNGILSLSYMKQVAGNRRGRRGMEQYLSIGGQIGFGQNSLNWSKFRFSTQFDGDDYNAGLGTGENAPDQRTSYLDLNAGLLWYGIFGKNKSAYAGGTISHPNRPNVGFYNEKERLFSRFTGNIGGEWGINRNISFLPSVLVMKQGPSFETTFGTNVRYTNRDWNELALKAGLATRLVGGYNGSANDAVITYVGIDFENWMFGISYDINSSSLKRVSNLRGAYELSVIYTEPQRRRGGVNCPRF